MDILITTGCSEKAHYNTPTLKNIVISQIESSIPEILSSIDAVSGNFKLSKTVTKLDVAGMKVGITKKETCYSELCLFPMLVYYIIKLLNRFTKSIYPKINIKNTIFTIGKGSLYFSRFILCFFTLGVVLSLNF